MYRLRFLTLCFNPCALCVKKHFSLPPSVSAANSYEDLAGVVVFASYLELPYFPLADSLNLSCNLSTDADGLFAFGRLFHSQPVEVQSNSYNR